MFVAILICPLSTIRVQFARAVFATRATLVAHGNLSNTPRGLTQIGNTKFIYNSIIIIIIIDITVADLGGGSRVSMELPFFLATYI